MLHDLGWQSLDGRRQDHCLVFFTKLLKDSRHLKQSVGTVRIPSSRTDHRIRPEQCSGGNCPTTTRQVPDEHTSREFPFPARQTLLFQTTQPSTSILLVHLNLLQSCSPRQVSLI